MVPMTSAQSASASANVLYSVTVAGSAEVPTAELPSKMPLGLDSPRAGGLVIAIDLDTRLPKLPSAAMEKDRFHLDAPW